MTKAQERTTKVSDRPLERSTTLTNILMACVLAGGSWWCNTIWNEQKVGNRLLNDAIKSIAVMQNEMLNQRKDIDRNTRRHDKNTSAIQEVRVDVDDIKKQIRAKELHNNGR